MCIKATRVAYAFSMQCFENATIVAYAGLRVKAEEHCKNQPTASTVAIYNNFHLIVIQNSST